MRNHEKIKKAVLSRASAIAGFALLLLLLSSAASYARIEREAYSISVSRIDQRIRLGEFHEAVIKIENKANSPLIFSAALDGDIAPYVSLNPASGTVEALSESEVKVLIFGDITGTFNGSITFSGNIDERIPVAFSVSDISATPVNALSIRINPVSDRAYINEKYRYRVDVQNLLLQEGINITLFYSMGHMGSERTYMLNRTFLEEKEEVQLDKSLTLIKEFDVPQFIRPGEYIINVRAEYLDLSSYASMRFYVYEPVAGYMLFGIIPIKWVAYTAVLAGLIAGTVFFIRKRMEQRKRYKGKVDISTLPKPGPRSAYIGKLAESNVKTYFDLDQLTIHTLVAGSTGGGKTVSAEVLVEEALMKKASVIVFDPTAQWSGFLRKCITRKMLALYPSFGMKKSDAKAFNGNVHQILDARQIIDIKKYMVPGEIHVFAINRLAPKDSDTLVANTIREVFKANLPESPELNTIIIFDEVHRLLPKFGGSGQGFIQIERGAREFRKWGVGLILISQVLTDFIGETKANINTEIQMRTRDEGDLNRIKNKYGGYMLQSLIKSATGTGMLENSAYNKGNPYFVSFRPLLHEHARLSDQELEQYNKYNDIIEDIEYEIEQLKEKEIDVFDLELELKMALDKVKSGSFNMVDIYLEGLTPRVKAHFENLGIKPEKREIKLVSEEELRLDYEKAKQERAKFEKENPELARASMAKQKAAAAMKLPALKLKNNVTVMTVQELIDSINTMDDATLNAHITGENVFADWIQPANKTVADKVRAAKTKEEIIIALEDFLYG